MRNPVVLVAEHVDESGAFDALRHHRAHFAVGIVLQLLDAIDGKAVRDHGPHIRLRIAKQWRQQKHVGVFRRQHARFEIGMIEILVRFVGIGGEEAVDAARTLIANADAAEIATRLRADDFVRTAAA